MINKSIERDERTTFVENISYAFGYKLVTFALLFDIMYRSYKFNEAPWDLFAIIIISGFAMTFYQYKQKILGKSFLKTLLLTITVSIISAVVIMLVK